MKPLRLLITGVAVFFLMIGKPKAQLQVTTSNVATELAQKITGEGVSISNATLTGGPRSKGFFINRGGTQIGIDSGIVLTSGRAKTAGTANGIDGSGFDNAINVLADNSLGLPGDIDLATEIGVLAPGTHDASILEFDFIPIGDTIRFNYVFSSEEYTPDFVCEFNDAFAFFISGPGITGLKNIALIPGTSTPVSILNVNNVVDPFLPLCPNNTSYYINNENNRFFTHDGHTTLLTAVSGVQACQTYHLKLVIMDVGDDQFDSGVFIEAGSLRSDPIRIDGHNPLNEFNLPYLAEGCVPGAIHINRSSKKPFPQTLNLIFAGTAVNGVDVLPIPATATIPANDSVVIIPITAIADLVPEGHESLKIYIANSCTTIFSDSIEIELRDVDMLSVTPIDSTRTCRNSPVQLEAPTGYTNYSWTNSVTLSSGNVNNPVATPVAPVTNYICTATIGTCTAQDSVLVRWKTVNIDSKTDVPCKNGLTGAISVSGTGWTNPTFAIDNSSFQPNGSFNGLASGDHWMKMKDASGCTDSVKVTLVQSFPDITINAVPSPASCSLTPDGNIAVTATGGNNSFSYSANGTNYQTANNLIVPEGVHTVYVKDGNGCIETLAPVVVAKINNVTVDAEPDIFICEGTSYTLQSVSNASNLSWTPLIAITNATTATPTTSATTTQKYYVTATLGSCTRVDSVIVNVWKAPVPDAGPDNSICYGITAQLQGAGGDQFEWTSDPTFVTGTDISNPVVKPGTTTSYFLHVKDARGCHSLQIDEVIVEVTPAVKIFAGRDTLVAIGQPLQLNAVETNASGVTQWEWAATNFLSNPFIASPVATFSSPVITSPYEYTYVVTGTTPEGCQGSDEIRIKVYKGPEIYVPTAFTPNNDGKNDRLMALPVGIKELRHFRVFNRWGQLVFATTNPSSGWDGTILGKEQPTSVYIWTAEGIDYTGQHVVRKGSTTLIK